MKKILTLSVFFGWGLVVVAQNQTVAVFKNGLSFFVKKQKIDASKGIYVLKEIPQPTFGTLWFMAEDNNIRRISSFEENIAEKQEAKSVSEIIRANVSRRATITLKNEPSKSYAGMIEKVEENLLIFKNNNQEWQAIPLDLVQTVLLSERPEMQYVPVQKKRIIQLDFAKNTKEQVLEMMYLQQGLTWVPSYVIDLIHDTKAKITLRATLLNDVEDLENVNLNFVVGVPNFAYTYLLSPLTSNQNVAEFINTLNRYSNTYYGNYTRRNDITQQSFANIATSDLEIAEEEIDFEGMKGQDAEDLFFYNLPNVSLKKGGRAFYDVLQAEVNYEHIYEVALKENTERSYYSKDYSDDQRPNQVFHSIRLQNSTQMPWTTGTALITKLSNNVRNPLSQDKLNYIPSGGKGKLKITIVPNITVKHSEKELSRVENQKKKDGYTYDLITVEGKVELKNFKDKPVKLNITRNIIGEALKSNEKWEVKKLFNIRQAINQNNQIDWEISLNAGQTKEILYEYKVFIQR